MAALFSRERAKLSQLTVLERVALLVDRCDPGARAVLATLTKNPRDFVAIDQCLAQKQKLDPAFRSWLAPKR